MSETRIVKYDVTEAAIAEMAKLYLPLTVKSIDDTDGIAAVHDARMVVKGHRVAVEKRRKELKADALAYGKMVDSEAKKIFDRLAPIESHLQAEEDKPKIEQERIKAEEDRKNREKIEKRVADLLKINVIMAFFDLATMTDDAYSEFYAFKKSEYDAEQARLAAAEAARKAKEEAEAKARADEDARLKAEREALDKIKQEQEAERERLKAEEARLAAEKREAEYQRQLEVAKKEAIAKAIEQARIAAEEAETARLFQEASAKAEAERQEALMPDREKIEAWITAVEDVEQPEVDSRVLTVLLDKYADKIYALMDELRDEIERM